MKLPIIILMLLLCAYYAQAQSGRFRGVRYVEGRLGFSEVGLTVSARYIYNYQNHLAGVVGIGAGRGSIAELTLTTIYADGGLSFNLYSSRRLFYLNILGGITLAGDFLNDFESEKISKRSFLTYGMLGGLEAELKMNRSLSFTLSGHQRYYFKPTFDEMSRWRYDFCAGLRISI